ncbi:hypothetical protein CRG98_029201 [Punica granatum]|uniref:Fe2OG dioxygenase domain-containing protein n=1 Tax=Punica granatum TaxID=22663 RepID=A0A2I0J2I8_PUNGR|nr:hypothetical protein CRG98_029201 [Punica granatum]
MGGFPGEFQKLREACAWGCFRIVNHEVPLELMAQMKAVVRELLDLPAEVKRKNTDVIAGSGYMAPSPKNPLYEALGLYDMGSRDAVLAFCSHLEASPHQRYEWPCQFRINKYNFTPETVGFSGVQIHTDSGFLTILQDDENVGGLEVMDQSGSFVPVEPQHGTFLVNLGDVAAVWSNGRWCNVKHRVQCKQAVVRISIATFLLGPKEEAIEAPEELVDSEHPRLYAPFTYEDYRKLRLSTKLQAGEALALLRADS